MADTNTYENEFPKYEATEALPRSQERILGVEDVNRFLEVSRNALRKNRDTTDVRFREEATKALGIMQNDTRIHFTSDAQKLFVKFLESKKQNKEEFAKELALPEDIFHIPSPEA